MDPLSGFLQIVSLLADYHSINKHRKEQPDADQMKDFIEWLVTAGHQELASKIEANHTTTVSIKAFLSESSSAILETLSRLERQTYE